MSTVPMFSPNGEYGEVPKERVQDALANGGQLAIQMKAPDGSIGYLPQDKAAVAMKNGGLPVTAPIQNPIPTKGKLQIAPRGIPAKVAALMFPGSQIGLEMGMGTATGDDTASERSLSKVIGQGEQLLSPRGALDFAVSATPFGAAKSGMEASRAGYNAAQNHTVCCNNRERF